MRYLSIFVLLVLSACSSTGTKVDQDKLSAFVKGKTTYTEVVRQLGKPDKSESFNNGTTIIKYTYKESVAKAANYIPIVGGFIEGGAGSEDTTVTIRFDSKSVLAGYVVSELDAKGVKRVTKQR
jgi:outer membrane protein assembly factor BamE (lipoprotein component of BamABCDE complex)